MIRALRRAGFEEAHRQGSHQTMKKRVGDRTYVTVVVLGLKEIPRGTMGSIIEQAGMTVDEFMTYLR